MYKIVKRREMAQGTVVLNEIEAPLIARKARPGQFVILRANETGERVPLTMAEANADQGRITVIYQVVGKSTKLFRDLDEGQAYLDVVGPLGRPTHIEKRPGLALVVGGGTGVAVVHNIAKGFKAAGNRVISIIGARTRDLLIMEDMMAAASEKLEVCTDDGSYGHHGFVTNVLKDYLEGREKVSEVICAGPAPMMRFVAKMTAGYNIPTLVSLNAIMIDATGMCGCCRVSIGGRTRFTCVDGPEFDGHQVDWDEFMQRLTAYKPQEFISAEQYDAGHPCKIGRGR
ncbi:MAG: sulfide/dihydroorotate dehydrogenase-like FAD/NAD-binding protein [Candidatus Adiutrix sp.]|jgi:ferredoxin--NADP+ reductase|nr:sulfide/dihydroorotate dehydrogenase-like FAD/NAD-binding protein [Candidatus Adiutrix sp.]